MRKGRQISVRHLFLATTVVAVVFGVARIGVIGFPEIFILAVFLSLTVLVSKILNALLAR